LVSASAIAPWPEGQDLPIFARDPSEAVLIAWRDGELAPLGITSDAAGASRARLRAPAECEQRLPRPAWAARWGALGGLVALEEAEREQLAPLTSDWVAARCAPLASVSISAEVGCEDRFCEHTLRSTGACGFELTFTGCARAPVRGALHADGSLCLGADADAPSCPVRAFVRPDDAPFTVDRVKVVEAARDVLPDWLTFNGLLVPDLMFEGWVHDLELVDGRVVALAGDGTFGGPCRAGFTRGSNLHFFDPATLALTGTATTPQCLTAIAADPEYPAIFGVFTAAGEWRVGKFDATGRLLASAPVDARTTAGPGEPRRVTFRDHRVLDVEVLPARDLVAVLFNPEADTGKEGNGGNVVFTYDRTTLERRGGWDYPDGQRWVMTAVDDHTLALARNDARAIEWLDVDSGPLGASAPLRRLDGVFNDDSLLDVAHHPASGTLLVAATRDPLLFTVTPRGAARGRAHVFDVDAAPVTALPWPPDPTRALVAGIVGTGEDRRAVVTRFDPTRPSFDSGTWDLGWGAPTKMLSDDEGHIFVLLPWSGDLVRLTPTRAQVR
ncbi:hypothetical protein L6R52_37445, partial [Myxococcota bacterium]|nr:hypothetical protein [Myxococcota bacterium]